MVVAENLRRAFGPILAVSDVSFQAQRGDVLGILGPNGAGKSTLMKIIACFLEPDKGTASVCGHDIRREPLKVKRSLGYLAENAPLYNEMTVWSFLNFICDARGLRGKARREAIDRVVHLCTVESVLHQTIETLSKGYRRRVGLAQALVHNPPVLMLDEPTDGLDPNQKLEVRKLITKLSKHTCVIVSTHILEEVEAICSRIIIMARGQIQVDSTPEKLKKTQDATLEQAFRRCTVAPAGAAEGART